MPTLPPFPDSLSASFSENTLLPAIVIVDYTRTALSVGETTQFQDDPRKIATASTANTSEFKMGEMRASSTIV